MLNRSESRLVLPWETRERDGASVITAPSRRKFMGQLGRLGVGALATSSILEACSKSSTSPSNSSATGDTAILNAATTAEALASVMYDNLIQSSLYTALNANADDQAYLVAGREQEAIHYATLSSAGGTLPSGVSAFFFPTGMFTDAQTTLNTLITLEDAFIAAYLIGVRDFSTDANKVLAAQILGVEAEHRVLGRVIAADLGLTSVTGLSGNAELVGGAGHSVNNIAFERTFASDFTTIADVVTALTPFIQSGANGYSTTAYAFNTTAGYYTTETPNVTLDVTGTTS